MVRERVQIRLLTKLSQKIRFQEKQKADLEERKVWIESVKRWVLPAVPILALGSLIYMSRKRPIV